MKRALCSAPVLILPDFDHDFTIECDASDTALGAVLAQDLGAGLQPVAYFSRKLRGSELNYPTHDRELMAVFVAVRRWRPYIEGKRTTILTDHRALQHLPT